MTATDELRRLLDERGVEYVEDHGYREFFWNFGEYGKARVSGIDTRGLVQMIVTGITPEQAVEATLGRGTCEMGIERTFERIDGDEEYLLECSECGSRRWWLAHMMPCYCPDCGRAVVDA